MSQGYRAEFKFRMVMGLAIEKCGRLVFNSPGKNKQAFNESESTYPIRGDRMGEGWMRAATSALAA